MWVRSLSRSCNVTGAAKCWVWKWFWQPSCSSWGQLISIWQVLRSRARYDSQLITCQRQVQDRFSTDINNNLHLPLCSYLWHITHCPQHWLGHLLVLTYSALTLCKELLSRSAVDASTPGWGLIVHSFFLPYTICGSYLWGDQQSCGFQ